MNTTYYTHNREEIMDLVQHKPNRLLDIGCGEGRFATALSQRFDAEAWGLEMDAHAAEEARKSLHTVLLGTFEAVGSQLPLAYFDAVFFNDVLEHMVDPWQTLRDIQPHLAAGARIYASIPNFLFAENVLLLFKTKDWIYTDAGILDRTHMRFFTKKSMLKMFEDCGLEVQTCQPLNAIDSFKWRMMNALTFGYTRDFLPMQYGLVAQVCRPA
ncbi:MAG: class I SAM-dependent methyltransferase [Sphingobacteriaceae bacterium]|nr:class I SAM-dependent methyltransferase [Sphingobacteriaceae bacterium]